MMLIVVAVIRKPVTNALVGFGTFSAVTCVARTGRNPQTGKPMKIAEKD